MDFHGKTVLITGCRRGIGRALVSAFARSGADVIAHARAQNDAFEVDMAQEAQHCGVTIRSLYFDMADADAMKAVVNPLLREVVPDVLVNNAAIQHGGFFVMTPVKKIQQIFDINLFAQMRLTQLVLKPMISRKSGTVINIASISGIDLKPGMAAYGVSKAAVIAWTQVLAAEMGQFGIRINAVAPGLTDTDGGALMEQKARDAMLAGSALHRLGKPEEIAAVACMLASDEASFLNGEIVRVDGGKM